MTTTLRSGLQGINRGALFLRKADAAEPTQISVWPSQGAAPDALVKLACDAIDERQEQVRSRTARPNQPGLRTFIAVGFLHSTSSQGALPNSAAAVPPLNMCPMVPHARA